MSQAAASPHRSSAGRPSRRRLLTGLGAGAVAAGLGGGALGVHRLLGSDASASEAPLLSRTVALDASGERTLVTASSPRLRTGTRLLAGTPADSATAERAKAFLDAAAPWLETVPGALQDLARGAIWDLWVLGDSLPAPVAGWSRNWRYIWPRDTAFCAVALARIGHRDAALDALAHLQQMQSGDGWFEARYSPSTQRSPDDRPRQFDGTGLALWAAREVIDTVASADGHESAAARERLAPMIFSGRTALRRTTDDGTRMPPVSPDYWERHERTVTLGIMASTLAGLEASAHLSSDGAAHGVDQYRDRDAADAFRELLTSTFGAHGYQRRESGGGADSALAFLDATGCSGIAGPDRLHVLREELSRPAGGIAPGARWRRDGISWTPSTSLLGLALARCGDDAGAKDVLEWIGAHRTSAGSIPEKVLADGSPASVAPLAWTAANVLLTIDALAGR
ncbi:hypothetical protein DEO23_02365 [Brachybacterium endophyticum]|uniref:Glycoside hydrolase family 15 n=1 Tax=Brachybacterium endophyticum TaxID=2182385 RepID=A0A2U2RNX6_9MICO|nr:hypothetical protein [Brachybacterium endophyticum]PWH07495.1 hypothetical protein DEO23_02365 [Brachybacterium endophyticum]